jgi:hypothetical protein
MNGKPSIIDAANSLEGFMAKEPNVLGVKIDQLGNDHLIVIIKNNASIPSLTNMWQGWPVTYKHAKEQPLEPQNQYTGHPETNDYACWHLMPETNEESDMIIIQSTSPTQAAELYAQYDAQKVENDKLEVRPGQFMQVVVKQYQKGNKFFRVFKVATGFDAHESDPFKPTCTIGGPKEAGPLKEFFRCRDNLKKGYESGIEEEHTPQEAAKKHLIRKYESEKNLIKASTEWPHSRNRTATVFVRFAEQYKDIGPMEFTVQSILEVKSISLIVPKGTPEPTTIEECKAISAKVDEYVDSKLPPKMARLRQLTIPDDSPIETWDREVLEEKFEILRQAAGAAVQEAEDKVV